MDARELAQAIGRRVLRRRVSGGSTLGDIGGAEFTDAEVEAIEAGTTLPTLEQLVVIAARVGMTVQELIPDDVDPEIVPLDFAKMDRGQLQRAHEMAVAYSSARFLRSKEMDVRGVRPGDPERQQPDALFDSGSFDGGFEITCVGYYPRGSQEARLYARDLWDLAGGHYATRTDRTIPVLSAEDLAEPENAAERLERFPVLENFDHVAAYAQELLALKCEKPPYSVPTILIIDAAMYHVPLTPADEGIDIARALVAPSGHHFERVYLRMSHNASVEREFFPVAIGSPFLARGPRPAIRTRSASPSRGSKFRWVPGRFSDARSGPSGALTRQDCLVSSVSSSR